MFTSLGVVDQAITNIFIGFGLALLNVIIRYFAPFVPRAISVMRWHNLRRAFMAAYLIALVLQMITSPVFRSYLHSTYLELAWSPYQALWNVIGVAIIDLLVIFVRGARRTATMGSQQIAQVKTRAAEGLDTLSDRITPTPDAQAAHRLQDEQAETERKRRMDDTLGGY